MIKALIIVAYITMLLPWGLYVLTGELLFAMLGLVYVALGLTLLPTAKRDWNL